MQSVAVHGYFGRISAFVLLDPARPSSSVAGTFVQSHNLPRTVSRDPRTMVALTSCVAPVSIRSEHGFYQTRHPMAVANFQTTWDVILGADWCAATGAAIRDGCVLDPPAAFVPAADYMWCGPNECPSFALFSCSCDYLLCAFALQCLHLMPTLLSVPTFFVCFARCARRCLN